MNFYNEFDSPAAAWLRELIARKLIPDGVVDERSISDLQPSDLHGYTQCHFFAGIGGWSLALELAGVDPARPLWTGSCPCQPYSAAGKGLGNADPRNLWPAFFRLIRECRPDVVFGEQVESAVGHGWLDGISADLEGEDYAIGAAVLGAHSVRAPHIRQRLYWVANAQGEQPHRSRDSRRGRGESPDNGNACGMGESNRIGSEAGIPGPDEGKEGITGEPDDSRNERIGGMGNTPSRGLGIVGDAARAGSGGHADGSGGASCGMGLTNSDRREPGHESAETARHGHPVEPAGFWSDSYWLLCRDGKHRRVPTKPAIFPLVDGLPYKLARRGSVRPALLKGAGNAIVPQVAAEFIQAYLDTLKP